MTTREKIDIEVPAPTGDIAAPPVEDASSLDAVDTESTPLDSSPETAGDTLAATSSGDTPAVSRESSTRSDPTVTPEIQEALQQDRVRLQQQIMQLQQQNVERDRQAIIAKHAEELLVYQQGLADQGVDPSQAARHVQSMQELQAERLSLSDERQNLQQRATLVQQNEAAKRIIAKDLATRFGVTTDDLMDFNTPELMEKAAENLSLRARLSKVTQATVAPSTTDNNQGSGTSGGGRANQLNRLVSKHSAGTMTDADWNQWAKLNATE